MTKFEAVLASAVQTATVEVYVPNRRSDGTLVHNHEHWVRLVEDALCAQTGGACTTYAARGRWLGAYEHTMVVRAAVPARQAHAAQLVATLGAFLVECGQDAAGYTVDGVWYLVRPAAPNED
jgi:hypothetical protein